LIVGFGNIGNLTFFPYENTTNSLLFGVSFLGYGLGMVGFCMALSTFFSDPKVANQIGGLILLIPQMIFLFLTTTDSNSKYILYALFWIPVTPACVVWCALVTNPLSTFNLVDTSWIPMPVAWTALFLNVPLWVIIYQYLEKVVPSEFGIAQHPCFCFRKTKVAEDA